MSHIRYEGPLFAPDPGPLARRTDPHTSHQAAAKMARSGKARSHGERMLAAVVANPGRTAKALGMIAGIERHEASRRLADLRRQGKVRRMDGLSKGGEMLWWAK